jgi:hypothetical protein
MTTAQVMAINTAGVQALTTDQLRGLSTSQFIALRTAQIAALTTDQISAFSDAEVLTLGNSPALQSGMSPTQMGAVNWVSTPIILDLNGDGVKTQSLAAGVKFDIFANGSGVNTGWVSASDGLLVLDRNSDGQINNGSELFGSSTTLASGAKAVDGYQALRELDTNGDGQITQADAAFADLRVWVDANSDGKTETGELKTLAALGITSINTRTTVGTTIDNGNLLGLTSTYQTADGTTHAAADAWFAVSEPGSGGQVPVDQAITALSNTVAVSGVSANVTSSNLVETMPTLQLASEPIKQGISVDLRGRVSSIAQALGTFSSTYGSPAVSLDAASVGASASGTLVSAIAGMADVMKQFDSDGNLIGAQTNSAASATTTLNLPGKEDPLTKGILFSTGNRLSS